MPSIGYELCEVLGVVYLHCKDMLIIVLFILCTEMPVDETGNAGECACDNNWNKNETELSSVCSDDFNDAVSTHSASGTIDVETGLECKEPTSASMNSATNCSYTTTCEVSS